MIILLLLMLFGCSYTKISSITEKRLKMLNDNDDRKIADYMIEQIIDCINSKNISEMQSLFSDEALKETKNFDELAKDLFNFIDDKIISWEALDGTGTTDLYEYGKQTKEMWPSFYISTEKEKYYVVLRYFPINSIIPENEGLYMILVVKAENRGDVWDETKKIIYDGDEKLSHAGIYIPVV